MKSKKIYEVANELGISSKKIMEALDKLNIPYKSHFSNLTSEQVEKIESQFKKKEEPKGSSGFYDSDVVYSPGDTPIIDKETGERLHPRKNQYNVVFMWVRNAPESISSYRAVERADFVTQEDPYYPLSNDVNSEGHYYIGDLILMKMPRDRWEYLRKKRYEDFEKLRLPSLEEMGRKESELKKRYGVEESPKIKFKVFKDLEIEE